MKRNLFLSIGILSLGLAISYAEDKEHTFCNLNLVKESVVKYDKIQGNPVYIEEVKEPAEGGIGTIKVEKSNSYATEYKCKDPDKKDKKSKNEDPKPEKSFQDTEKLRGLYYLKSEPGLCFLKSEQVIKKQSEKLRKFMASGMPPSTKGLERLRVSGSRQFTIPVLQTIVESIKEYKPNLKGKNIYIMDLRMETHGFAGDYPIALYQEKNQLNLDKSNDQIKKEEEAWIDQLNNNPNPAIAVLGKYKSGENIYKSRVKKVYTWKKSDVGPNVTFKTEEQVADKAGVNYKRFYILDHHRPTIEEVDRYVEFIRGLPEEHWLHFHCKGGKGRTTSFLVMYDMLVNGSNVDFEDIIIRQHALNGSNLGKISNTLKAAWKQEAAQDRYTLLYYFYLYSIDPFVGFKAGYSFSQFLMDKHITDEQMPYRPATLLPGEEPPSQPKAF